MHQVSNKGGSKEDFQSLLVVFFIVFVVFVKCYMVWVHPAVQKAYESTQQKIETRSQVLWGYPNWVIPPIDK